MTGRQYAIIAALTMVFFITPGLVDAVSVRSWNLKSLNLRTTGSIQKSQVNCEVDAVVVANGTSRTYYNVDSVALGDSCSAHGTARTCQAGVLSGSESYGHSTCALDECTDRNSIFKDACSETAFTSEYDDLKSNVDGWLDPSDKSVPATYTISTAAQLRSLAPSLLPGDTLEVTDGTWTNEVIGLTLSGTSNAPITIRAQHQGGVILTGGSRVSLNGSYIRFEGFKFTGSFNTSSGASALTLGNSSPGCKHCTGSDLMFDGYNPPDLHTRTFYVSMSGQWVRLTHSSLLSQYNYGLMVTTDSSRVIRGPDYYLIDHNYFKDRPDGYSLTGYTNGFETIAMHSSYKGVLTELYGPYWAESHSFIRNNFFEDVNGEAELISLKASKIGIQSNTFLRSGGAVTFRASNDSVVEANGFSSAVGESDKTGGVRIIGSRNVIIHNIFQSLDPKGYDYMYPITVYRGDPNPFSANGGQYIPVTSSLVAFNLLANNRRNIIVGSGNSSASSVYPSMSQLAYNVVQYGTSTETTSSFGGIPTTTISIHDNKLALATTTVSGFTSISTNAATYSSLSGLYEASSTYSYIEQPNRRLLKSLLDQLPQSASQKADIVYRLQYINSSPTSTIPFRMYSDADVGGSIGARSY